ncbi:MAG: hypothetical protein QXT06_02115 [Candidatus Bathyarchaeia archaeon]
MKTEGGEQARIISEPRFEKGLTLRTSLAIFFASFLFMPISIYLQLTAGAAIGSIAVFATVILFSEISLAVGSPLKKQELFIIFQMCGIAATTTYMVELIYRGYMVTSPLSQSFRIMGRSMPEMIPSWWAPPSSSESYIIRTLFHLDWLIPSLLTVVFGIFTILTEFAILTITSLLYIEVEKLPFPMASLTADMVTTLAEREPYKIGLFSEAAILGAIIGALFHLPRLFLGIEIVPFPWADFTNLTDQILPGAIIGVATEPLSYISATLIPWIPAAYIFVTSIIVYIILNPLFIKVIPQAFPKWSEEYMSGMGISLIYQRSQINVWLVPGLIFSIMISAFFTIKDAKIVSRALRSLSLLSSRETGYFRLPIILGMYFIGTLGSVITFHILVPDMPIIMPLLFSVGLSFLNGIVGARILGETGQTFSLPTGNIWRTYVYLSGYQGVAGWLISPVIGGGLSSGWTQDIKVAYLTRTRPGDFFKAFILAWIAYRISGFIWGSFLWTFAPIPSSTYPATLISWPLSLMVDGIWITRQIDVRTDIILYSSICVAAILLLSVALPEFLRIPFSLSGVAVGVMTPPPSTIPLFIGSSISRFLIPKIFGERWWRENRALIVSGFATGEGIIIGFGIIAALIRRSIWSWPF